MGADWPYKFPKPMTLAEFADTLPEAKTFPPRVRLFLTEQRWTRPGYDHLPQYKCVGDIVSGILDGSINRYYPAMGAKTIEWLWSVLSDKPCPVRGQIHGSPALTSRLSPN